MTVSFKQDYPISFAEEIPDTTTDNDNSTTTFYVEWLDNSNDFPSLSPSMNNKSTTPTVQSKVGTWELLQRSEVNNASINPTQQQQQQQQQLYSRMVEKNAAELQPSQRNVQALHSYQTSQKKKLHQEQRLENDAEIADFYDDLDLFNFHKSQSRKANRSKHLKAGKTVDVHIEGTLRLATSRQGRTHLLWIPDDGNSLIMARPDTIQLQNNNSQALLSFSAKTAVPSSSAHKKQRELNHAAAFYKYSPLLDNSDYSVLSTKIKC